MLNISLYDPDPVPDGRVELQCALFWVVLKRKYSAGTSEPKGII